MPEPFRACLDCGLVWNNVRREKLCRILEREGIAFPLVRGKDLTFHDES
jgi:hypothetical protein